MPRLHRLIAAAATVCAAVVHAATPAYPHPQGAPPSALQRFLARAGEPPVEYRALRRLEAQNQKFKQSAWMTAWTEFDRVKGLRYDIVEEGGSGYIRSKVLRAALDGEQKIW